MQEEVFISYKSEEYDKANAVRRRLEGDGIGCWMAPDCIEGGKSYAQQIPNAIRNASIVVVLVSSAAMASKWVAREVDRALNEDKRVMPFMIENVPLTDEFNFYLTNVQQYPAYLDFDGELERMAKDIRSALGLPKEKSAEEKPAAGSEQDALKYSDIGQADKKPSEAPAVNEHLSGSEFIPGRTEKAKRPRKTRTPKAEKNGKRKRFVLPFILACAAAVIAAAIILSTLRFVKIGGQKINKYDRYLSLTGCVLTQNDINQIGSIRKLYSIDLSGSTIEAEDLRPLMHADLLTLRLADCGISDGQFATLGLAGSSVTALDISGNKFNMLTDAYTSGGGADTATTGYTFWENAFPKGLTSLDISRTSLPAAAVKGLGNLAILMMDSNGISDLSPLRRMQNLEKLSASDNEISDLSPLEECIYLREIRLSGNRITSLDGLKNTTKLTMIDLSDNRISDLSPLSNSAGEISYLYIQNNNVSAFNMGPMPKLMVLNADNNALESLSPLFNSKGLFNLSVKGNKKLSSLPPKGLKLTYLSMAGCAISGERKACPVSGDYSVSLDLSGTGAKSVDFARANYSRLNLIGTDLDDTSLSSLYLAHGSSLFIEYSDKLDLAQLKPDWTAIYMVGVPLDKRVGITESFGSRIRFIEAGEADALFGEPPSILTEYR